MELIMRMISEGTHFLACSNALQQWNAFDTLLVLSGLLDELAAAFSTSTGLDTSALKLLRILKLVRVVRVMRVLRFFSELRVMVAGIIGSVASLGWALLLLCMILYMFAACLMQ